MSEDAALDAEGSGTAFRAENAASGSRQRSNFSSTPCQAIGDSDLASHSLHPVRYATSGHRLFSAGGISHITPGNANLRLPSQGITQSVATALQGSSPLCGLAGAKNLTTNFISTVVPVSGGLTLTCHNVNMWKSSDKKIPELFQFSRRQEKTAAVLADISANFPPGLNAIMGPSGCGKTSLLSVLSCRKTACSGTIRINGKSATRNLRRFCGYTTQEDVLNPGLTVREHLWYSLCLRRSGHLSHDQKTAVVNDILTSLRLRGCSDRKVGFPERTLISGGERKRTAIAMELVAGPKILFLDEPTSSLDSTTSKYVMKILRELADRGRTIILTIHQPSSALFKKCDNLTLLAKSRLVYHGEATRALRYFTSLGFPHEPHYSAPDFLLDILFGQIISNQCRTSARHRRRPHSGRCPGFTPTYWTTVGFEDADEPAQIGLRMAANTAVPAIRITRDSFSAASINNNPGSAINPEESIFLDGYTCGYTTVLDGTTKEGARRHSDIAWWLAEEYKVSSLGRETQDGLRALENKAGNSDFCLSTVTEMRSTSLIEECYLLCRRTLSASARLCAVLAFMNVAIGLLFGILYYHPYGQPHPLVQNRLGLFFYLSVHGIIVPAMITAKNFVTHEKLLFEHERRAGFYGVASYSISRYLIALMTRIFSAPALSIIVYWLTGLNPNVEAFLVFTLTAFTAGLASDSLCLLCALGCQSFAVGKSIVMLYMALTSVFAGFLLNLDSTFPWLAWVKYVSISRYCYVGWVVGEFTSTCHENTEAVDQFVCDGVEEGVLTEIVGSDRFLLKHPWTGQVILFCISVVFTICCYARIRLCKT